MIDLNGCLSFCNEYTLTITGWAADEVIGHPAKDFLDPEDLRHLTEAIDASQTPGRSQPFSESAILTKTGGAGGFNGLIPPCGTQATGLSVWRVWAPMSPSYRVSAPSRERESEARLPESCRHSAGNDLGGGAG